MRVRYTPQALSDLEAVLDSIERHSPRGARRVQARIKGVIDLLPQQPLIGARTDDDAIWRFVLTPYPYVLFYEVAGDAVIIHAVRHAARSPDSMPGSR